VEGVYKDTPAQRLGLSKGDIILEVEGISTLEMSEQEFERALVGPEGTEVELHVRFQDSDGDWEGVVNLQRSALDGLFKKP
jgi:C-terminal processing protease CtpA/Prc